MKSYFKVISLFSILNLPIFSQAPDTIWTKTYGLSGSEYGTFVQQTSDGGYIITGVTTSIGAGGDDTGLIKTDSLGNLMWLIPFGGDKDDRGKSVRQTLDGGYIIIGSTESFGFGNADVWIIKTDALGSMQWERAIGGTEYDFGESISLTNDGGYIATGYTASFGVGGMDAALMKLDQDGMIEWLKFYGGTEADYGESVQQTYSRTPIIQT